MKNIMEYCRKHAFYVMAGVLVAGILAVSGIAGFMSGQSEQEVAENAAEFTDKTAENTDGDATQMAASDLEDDVVDEMNGYNADVVQKILTMIEDGTLALEDFEDESSVIGSAAAEEALSDAVDAEETEAAEEDEAVDASVNTREWGYHQLTWPVEGEIVLDYSMDATVYYPTLDQYQCNPSVLIQSEVGTDVVASCAGTVTAVEEDAQLGMVVTVDAGDGYEVSYGQLTNVTTAVGETIEEGEVIGVVSDPTRYYSVEGSHLNFKVTKDGSPVDPLDYLN